MSESDLSPQATPQGPRVEHDLWEQAPRWRKLTIAASFLTLVVVALPTLLPQPEAITSVPQSALVKQVALAAPVSPTPSPSVSLTQSAPYPASPIYPASPMHVAVPLAESQAQAPVSAPTACALRQPTAPLPMGVGTIIGIQDPAVARADIPMREARLGGAINPRYLNDLRAVVRQDDGRVQAFDVPQGITVHVGDRVTLQNSYRDTSLSCSYIPILITADSGPAPTTAQGPQ